MMQRMFKVLAIVKNLSYCGLLFANPRILHIKPP